MGAIQSLHISRCGLREAQTLKVRHRPPRLEKGATATSTYDWLRIGLRSSAGKAACGHVTVLHRAVGPSNIEVLQRETPC
jgi:hypothetical protein